MQQSNNLWNKWKWGPKNKVVSDKVETDFKGKNANAKCYKNIILLENNWFVSLV